MTRTPVREVSAPSEIRPVAAPVSTYVRPADPGRNPLADLASGLAAFDQGLNSFMAVRKQETEEADKARAITDFHRNNQVSYAEAIRQGLIPASSSRSYMEWYKRSQGELAGLKLQDKFNLDYQQWEGRNNADSASYSTWASQWMKENVGAEQDPDTLKGLAPHLERLSMGGLNTFMTDRNNRIVENARATSGSLITDNLLRAVGDGEATGQIDYDSVWSHTMELRQEALSKGEDPVAYDKMMVDTILLQAESARDDSILTLLDKTLPDRDKPLSYDPDVRSRIAQSRERIDNKLASMATTEATAAEKQDKRQHEEYWSEAVALMANGEEVPEDLVIKLSRRDGMARMKISQYKKDYGELDVVEDQQALLEVMSKLYAGGGKDVVLEAQEKGIIRKPETLQKAYSTVDAVKKASQDDGVFSSSTFKQYQKFILSQTAPSNLTNFFGEPELTEEGMEADYDFRTMVLKWESENPKAGVIQREKAIRDIGEIVKGRLVTDPDRAGGQKMYVSKADQKLLEEQVKQEEQQKANPPAPAQAPQKQAQRDPDGGIFSYIPKVIEDVGSYVFSTPEKEEFSNGEEYRGVAKSSSPLGEAIEDKAKNDAIARLAEKRGMSFEDAQSLVNERVQKLLEEDPTRAVSSESKTKLSALFQDPPKVERLTASNVPVAPLLNLFGHTEGTDKGEGYNETLGYGAYTGGKVNLVDMTLGDLDRLQTQMLRHPNNEFNSSAVGRYQVVRTTLRKIKKQLNLTDDMKFTAKLQDRIAVQLLKGRGLDAWQAGKLSDEKFMNNLALEWASLPKSNGRGAYKGQRAAVAPSTVKGVLGQVRGTQVASLDPSIGLPSSPSDPYSNIPDVDSKGVSGQREKFRQWNSDPVGNHEKNLQTIEPKLADVVRKAQEYSAIKFVVGAGKRDAETQKKAVDWGWSKTEDSDHLHGGAVDLWPVDASGAVKFDPKTQTEIVKAMKKAAKELGVKLDVGADWKRFKDLPHFGLKS